MTESDISELLAVRYAPPAWAYLPQVRNGTGYQRSTIRTADGLAMSLYPSRGIDLYGFEIKVSRSDWHHELANPEKAEHFFGICDYWWVVAPKEIVLLEEVPATWGFMSVGKKIKVEKQAPRLQPKQMDRLQLAAIFRNLQENFSPEAQIEAAEERGVAEGRKEGADVMKSLNDQIKKYQKSIDAFGRASGVSIYSWDSEERLREIGKAVNIVLTGQDTQILGRLKYLRDQMKTLLDRCDEALEEKKDGKEKESP
jgi:flagellar biosynthesis/type III secretory pathway protein FliH